MQIESLADSGNKKSIVKLDNGESFSLYKGEVRLLKLKEGAELSPAAYEQIMTVILPKRAKLRAMNLLKVRPYSEYDLTKKLKDGGYPESIICNAIDYVKSYGYINDDDYALNFIKTYSGRKSKKEIYNMLSMKGIKKETADAVFDSIDASCDRYPDEAFDESEIIYKALAKRGATGKESYEDRQKLFAYFYRRGFGTDAIYKAYERLSECDLT